MTEKNSKYVKLMAKIWSILIEYERWEERETDLECSNCENSHCGNCRLKQNKEKKRKETIEEIASLISNKDVGKNGMIQNFNVQNETQKGE